MIDILEQNIFWLLTVGAILLLLALFFQFKWQVKRIVKNEIYDHFPSIKNKIEDYERRLERLKLEADACERRLKETGKHG
jgi:F0F1-type ATP synthase membrane subunit b/b'